MTKGELKAEIQQIFNGEINAVTTALLMQLAESYAQKQLLQQTQCTTLLPDVEQVIKSRIEYFNSHYHKYEGKELSDAISTIKRLVPPSMFEDLVRQ